MDIWYIKLKCYDASGYFTGIIQTSIENEVGIHPYKQRAKRFTSKIDALSTAKYLKLHFKCIISYEVVK